MSSEMKEPSPASSSRAAASSPEDSSSARSGSRKRILRDVALLLARHEVKQLRHWFEMFDRDILLPILLGEIALHNITVAKNGDAGDHAGCELKPCNAYSISAATGLPRETVRRKIARLVELGWVSRRSNGHLYVSSTAVDHFGQMLTSVELAELLETAERARALLGD